MGRSESQHPLGHKPHELECPRAKLGAEHSGLKGQVAAWECSPKLPELLIFFQENAEIRFLYETSQFFNLNF